VAPSQVAAWNSVNTNARFKQGETVVVFVSPARAKATRTAANGGRIKSGRRNTRVAETH